jgi:hypothetical protein
MEIIIILSLIAGLLCIASVAPRLAIAIVLTPGILFLLVMGRFLFGPP